MERTRGHSDKPGSVLIVDDEPVIQRLLANVLGDAGFEVDVATSSTEAVQKLSDQPYEVALIDKNLGGENGLELIRELRQIRDDLSCAIITGYASVESCYEALDVGAVGYLWKPFEDVAQIVEQVRTMIEDHRRRVGLRERFKDLGRSVAAARLSRPPKPTTATIPPVRATPVLVVVPETGMRRALEALLGSSGFEVQAVPAVPNAIQAFQAGSTEVLVVDESIDKTSGLEFLAKIRTLDRDVAFVLVAASPTLSVLTRLIQLGGTGCLPKPLPDADAVVARIRAAGARCRRQRSPTTGTQPAPPEE